ncbi:hypothetical protein BV898_12681 [Hypsibius exemplaris]|uniref:Uncharacterized protein n=1 Tax=Hypsibius exemplaris TaxID=2072580 RepID=A0A1W0WCX8_HYPEX|nr:hypothetical protein BV898_12681 [Hypsibius exemplaris]
MSTCHPGGSEGGSGGSGGGSGGGSSGSGGGSGGGTYSLSKRWPNHISIDLLKTTICHASDQDVTSRVAELQAHYVRLNCAVREAKQYRNELTRSCADNTQTLALLDEKVRGVDKCVQETQSKLDEQNGLACEYDCEVKLLQNQPPPRLPPNVTEDLQMGADLERLSDRIFELYGALLVLRAGEVVLFEDMKRTLEKRPLATRQIKCSISDLRKRIRDYEQKIFRLTGEQRNWKCTLKTSKAHICKRARHQHNGLKEEAARLKRTIELFNEEKQRLMLASKDFEEALSTTIGEPELAELMEHFENFADPMHHLQQLTVDNGQTPTATPTTGNLRSMFIKPMQGMASASGFRGKTTNVSVAVVQEAERVSGLQKLYLDCVATKVKMEGNLLRTDFDIGLLETSLTAESYYDRKKPEEEQRKIIKGIMRGVTSDELLSVNNNEIAEYFDPEVKFPGRNQCVANAAKHCPL